MLPSESVAKGHCFADESCNQRHSDVKRVLNGRHRHVHVSARKDADAPTLFGSRHMEQTHVLHSARSPARIVARSFAMGSLFSARDRSGAGSGGPEIKKQGCTRPVAPTTAENSGALQRTTG